MACQLPVVATKVRGLPELIDNGENGFLVESHNAQALAEKIMRLINNSALRKRFGIAGRQKVMRKFNIEKQTDTILNLFQKGDST